MDAQLILAQTIYGEARGEGRKGMEAVAAVIMNRTLVGGWWGDEVISVAKTPYQFSVWNEGDPNRDLISSKAPGQGDPVFELAWEIAGRAIRGELEDPTGGADHYYNPHVVTPRWAEHFTETAVIGNHRFGTVA